MELIPVNLFKNKRQITHFQGIMPWDNTFTLKEKNMRIEKNQAKTRPNSARQISSPAPPRPAPRAQGAKK